MLEYEMRKARLLSRTFTSGEHTTFHFMVHGGYICSVVISDTCSVDGLIPKGS